MHKPYLVLLGSCLLLAFSGCNSDALDSTLPPLSTPPATQVARQVGSWNWGSNQQTLAIFSVSLNPDTLDCTVEPLPMRRGANQGEYFDMDLADFLIETGRSASIPAMFAVESISLDDDRDVELNFTHAHPFPAPNPFDDPSVDNRADLAYTGRVLMLADLNGLTAADFTFDFTAGTRIANTEALKAPDGYMSPFDTVGGESLVRSLHDPDPASGEVKPEHVLETNTFPYVLLADELKDNRFANDCAITNGDVMTGNYGKQWDGSGLTGGWQLDNMYSPAVLGLEDEEEFERLPDHLLQWTGYDYVHHGQSIRNKLVVQREYLLEFNLNFLVAVVIKYTDPINGVGATQRRPHLLPPATVDVSGFAYRLPQAALDYSVVTVAATGVDTGDPIPVDQNDASTTIDLFVRDWDPTALPEDTDGDDDGVLHDESNVALVFEGAEGFAGSGEVRSPHFNSNATCIAVMGTLGHPKQELPYSVSIDDSNVSGLLPGDYQVMVRFVDPEQSSLDS